MKTAGLHGNGAHCPIIKRKRNKTKKIYIYIKNEKNEGKKKRKNNLRLDLDFIIIIIMYIYDALINALSAHMIHINLNMIFYAHVKHNTY